MKPNAFIISLAYPETIVRLPEERFSKYLHYFGIGNRHFIRAGHAALVLVDIETGKLEYFDFGRYITPLGFGRLRSARTDHELNLKCKAEIHNNKISNLDVILRFLATNPKFTHGDGTMYASVCKEINYKKAKSYLTNLQERGLVRYAAFLKDASNCARLVMDTIIASGTNGKLRQNLFKLKKFTPSTVGTVVLADTENFIYQVSTDGLISEFKGSVKLRNALFFLDKLTKQKLQLKGTEHPIKVKDLSSKAQWLGGIGAGAWFDLLSKQADGLYRFKRISCYGTVDTDSLYNVNNAVFDIDKNYQFQHRSNCDTLWLQQEGKVFKLNYVRKYKPVSSMQKVHLI